MADQQRRPVRPALTPDGKAVTGLLAALRAFYATQLYLWERYEQRHNLTGRDTRAALHEPRLDPLHWTGNQLRGDVLPPT